VKSGGLSTNAKLGILGGLLLLAVVVGWFLIIAPKRHEASSLSSQIDDTRLQITELQSGGSGSSVQPIRVADLFNLSRAMPDRTDIPTVLLQLSDISAETGVTFQSITPHDPVTVGSYQQIGIDLTFQGLFYNLSDFLYRLRNMVGVHQGVLSATGRLFSVDAISFSEGDLKFPQVSAKLTVSAYVFGDGTYTPEPIITTTPSVPAAPGTATPAAPAPSSEGQQPIPAAPPGATAAGALK
jgi:type IV pilus assembly PilO-like protein